MVARTPGRAPPPLKEEPAMDRQYDLIVAAQSGG
jgi:hypothetical protein